MIFTLTIDLPVLCLCTLLESETLWTGELRSSLTGSVWETIGPQCSASQTCALPQHSRAGGEPLHVPSLLLKEIQAALSLRASFLNLPYPFFPLSEHLSRTLALYETPLSPCKLTLCHWDSLRTCSFVDAGETRLGDSGDLVVRKLYHVKLTPELIRIY